MSDMEYTIIKPPCSQGPYRTAGPWVGEPDCVEWFYTGPLADAIGGLVCNISRNPALGGLNGYVRVGEEYAQFYGHLRTAEQRFEVHGGVTFMGSNTYLESLRWDDVRKTEHLLGRLDTSMWVGFDCNHMGDLSPMWSPIVVGYTDRTKDHMGHTDRLTPTGDYGGHGTYRTLEFVYEQTNKLASQIAAVIRVSQTTGQ